MRICYVASSLLLVLACDSPSGTSGDIAQITVVPPLYAAVPGESATLTATAFDAQGRAVTGVSFDWSSSSAAASVSGGHVSALDAGSAVVTASAGPVSGSAHVRVSSCESGGGPFDIVAGGASCHRTVGVLLDDTLRVRALTPGNEEVTGVVWTSTNTGVATVDQAGLVATLTRGTTTIRGTTANSVASIEVVVDTSGVITFLPDNVTIATGQDTVLVLEPRVAGWIAPSTHFDLVMSDSTVIEDTYHNANRKENFLLVTGRSRGETMLSFTYRNMTGSARVIVE